MIDASVTSIAALLFSGVASAGVIVTVIRNGKSVAKKDTELKVELKAEIGHVKAQLADPNTGLSAISAKISSMKENCAGVTGDFAARIKGLEKKKK